MLDYKVMSVIAAADARVAVAQQFLALRASVDYLEANAQYHAVLPVVAKDDAKVVSAKFAEKEQARCLHAAELDAALTNTPSVNIACTSQGGLVPPPTVES